MADLMDNLMRNVLTGELTHKDGSPLTEQEKKRLMEDALIHAEAGNKLLDLINPILHGSNISAVEVAVTYLAANLAKCRTEDKTQAINYAVFLLSNVQMQLITNYDHFTGPLKADDLAKSVKH